ncbi:hypothetical protein AFLA_008110 [Aspergillus flavus NRRL3357]|nr:hypothetical protein AFLA_008110 [Aspergillus flavus NRRL3357]
MTTICPSNDIKSRESRLYGGCCSNPTTDYLIPPNFLPSLVLNFASYLFWPLEPTICQEKFGRDKFPPTFWAFCQVADIAKLEQMISQAESVDSETAQLILEPTIKDCDSIIDRWLGRLDSAAVKCKERDNGECILTRFPGPNVDIYPSCLLAASAREPRAVERF